VDAPGPLPRTPLAHLRNSRSDLVRALVERQPNWAHVLPAHAQQDGPRGVTLHRLVPDSFALQVRWRWSGAAWEEGEIDVLPGSVVALRLVLADVRPESVTKALGLVPTRAFAKGDIGPIVGVKRPEGLWIRESMPATFCFAEEKVAEILALLRGAAGWRDVVGRAGVRWAGVAVKLRGPIERPTSLALDARTLEDLVGLSLALDVEVATE